MAHPLKPPATQRVYDACVVGSQLGGAVAGALLARRGYRVLHVDHDGMGGSYEDGGYQLPYAPAVLPSPRLYPAAEGALSELGLTTDLGRMLEPSRPDLQILMPRHRLDLAHDPARRLAELRREFSEDAERLEAAILELGRQFDAATPFLKALPPLPPAGFFEGREIRKAVRVAASVPGAPPEGVGEGHPFQGLEEHPLVAGLLTTTSFLSYVDGPPSPLSVARLLGGALRGTFRLSGGYEGLRDMVRRKIAESRGEVLGADEAPAIAERFELDGPRIAGLRLEGSPNSFVSRVFIAATDAPAVRRLLPASELGGKATAILDKVRPRRQLFAVNLVVREAALPAALGQTVAVLWDGGGADAVENALLLQVLPAQRGGRKGETVKGEHVVCVGAFVPAAARDRGDAHLASLGQKLRERVEEAIPFFDRHLLHASIPALAAPSDRRGSRLLSHPLYELGMPQTLGVTGLPCRSPYKNLVFAGREVVPGLGIEGEFHAGLQAAAAAHEIIGRKDLLK